MEPTDEQPDDWRLRSQANFLQGVTLIRRPYRQDSPNPDWDHDHCEFCFAKFSLDEKLDALRSGYATLDDSHWICEQCFLDFRERFEWKLEPPGEEHGDG